MTDIEPNRSLPPRPDTHTGLPRPPHAPGFAGDPRAQAVDRESAGLLTWKPGAPPEHGPALVWYRLSWRASRCVVGADWLLYRGAWVKTYELIEVHTEVVPDNQIMLTLTDSGGRTIEAGFAALQRDRRVWDYLYNGIRHSIAAGAELHGTAHQYFVVGLPPRRGAPP
jgi:hypothetical protein